MKVALSPPVKLVASSAAELFIETIATAVAAAIVENTKTNRKPGKLLRLIRNNKEENNVQLHDQSTQSETTNR